MLRDIEAKMQQGINMATVDQTVFHGKRQHRFPASGEVFPDDKGEFSRDRIKGGTTKVEKWVAWSFFCVWVLLLVLTLKAFLFPALCRIWPQCQSAAPSNRSAVFE